MWGSSWMGLYKLILVDKRNRLGGYMMTIAIIKSRRRTVYDDNDKIHMIRYHFTDNESYWQMVITMKIHWSRFLRVRIDLLLTTLGVDDAQLFGHHQDRVIRVWFGYMKALQRCEVTSCLTSPWGQRSPNYLGVPKTMSWVYVPSLPMIC